MKQIIKRLRLKLKYKDCFIDTDQVHPEAFLGKGVRLAKEVSIGNDVSINDYSYVGKYSTIGSALIGKYCSIGPYCNIGPDSHPISWISSSPLFYKNYSLQRDSGYLEPKERPIIGNDVWIGSHVIILKGVTIGDGAVLAAGSVVTKNVEPYSIVGGVPAKHLKFRFEREQIEKIIEKDIWNEKFSNDKKKELSSKKESFLDFL